MTLLGLINSEHARYIFVGGITAVFYFGAIAFGTEVLGIEYRTVISVSYLIAVSFHFYANRKFTFAASDGVVHVQVTRYISVLLLNYLITIAIVSYLVEFSFFSYYTAAMIAIVLTIVVGYLTSKFWVFNKKEIS